MRTSAELAAWLLDEGRKGAAKKAADATAARWSEHPLFQDLRKELGRMPNRTVAAVLGAAERFMDRSGELEMLLLDLIDQAQRDPFFCPPLMNMTSGINSGYLLFTDQDVTISLGVISADALAAKRMSAAGQTAIACTGFLTSYRFLKAGGATISLWEAPEAGAGFSSDIGGSCRFVERRKIGDGERMLLDGRRQSIVIEHLTSDMLCLQASVQIEAAPLSIDYDSRTLRYIGATSTDEASSRTQMMVTLLRLMDRADAMPVIEQALQSPHFYTRWHVIREMLALDAEAALPSLRRMAQTDPHPEVRFAATQALSLFFNEEAEELIQCRA